jgi:pilus assembly protein Flp/PilA
MCVIGAESRGETPARFGRAYSPLTISPQVALRAIVGRVGVARHGRCPLLETSCDRATTRDRISHTTVCASEGRAGGNVMDFKARMRAFVADDSGQDLLEYALLVGLIALVAVLAVTSTGQSVNNIFQAISNSLSTIA